MRFSERASSRTRGGLGMFLCRWVGIESVGEGRGDIGVASIEHEGEGGGYVYRSIYLHCYGDIDTESVRR